MEILHIPNGTVPVIHETVSDDEDVVTDKVARYGHIPLSPLWDLIVVIQDDAGGHDEYGDQKHGDDGLRQIP